MAKLIVVFRNFASAPKKEQVYLVVRVKSQEIRSTYVCSLKLNESIVITESIQKPVSLSFYETTSAARCVASLTFENNVEMT
jgi:hypothetical protein